MTQHPIPFLLLTLVVTWFAGCTPNENVGTAPSSSNTGGTAEGEQADDLRSLRQVYLDHHDAHGQGPASWEAALEFARLSDTYDPAALERLRTAGCQVRWGGKISDAVDGADNYIIAEVPGGPKLAISGAINP